VLPEESQRLVIQPQAVQLWEEVMNSSLKAMVERYLIG
jgi:hypothetical protein